MKKLFLWFKKYGRHSLPWRKKGITAYEVWVSEIMLQQTQVSRVIPYYERILKRFPTVFELAKASWEEFLPYYQGLGYYRRGRNMLRTAKIIVEDFQGEFPRDRRILESLPGIGKYTAPAILSFSYGEKHLAWDTNLQRIFGRIFHGNRKYPVDQTGIEKKISKKYTDFRVLNAALMDFANLVCLNMNPKCHECPLQKECMYSKTQGKREEKKVTEKTFFDSKNAQVILTLHKDHKEYYSSFADHYSPFTLEPPYNTREKIKEYFKENYGLEVAVRPPHKKDSVDGKPTLFINAQILLGEHSFAVFKDRII